MLRHRDANHASPSGRAKQLSRPGLLRRLRDAVVASREQQIQQEIARHIVESTGGKLTDSVEREIEERLYPHSRDRLFWAWTYQAINGSLEWAQARRGRCGPGRAATALSQRNELAELLDGLLEAAAAVVEGASPQSVARIAATKCNARATGPRE